MYSRATSLIVFSLLVATKPCFSSQQLIAENIPATLTAGPFDDSITYVCKVKNAGKDLYTIKSVSPSCSCEKIYLDKHALNPGEEAKIAVNIKTPLTPLHSAISIAIQSDSVTAEPLVISLNITKIPYIEYDTRLVTWNSGESFSKKALTFKIASGADIKSISISNSRFASRLESESTNSDQKSYKLWIWPLSPRGLPSADISLIIIYDVAGAKRTETMDFYAVTT